MMDLEGRITYMNREAQDVTQWTFDEAKGKVLHQLIHHSHPDGRNFPIEECPIGLCFFQGKSVRNHEDVFIKKDGVFFPVLCAEVPVTINGESIGAVIEFQDITERKQNEQALKESQEKLQELNIRLVEQNEKLARKNVELDNFIYTASHDLKAPISNIEGLLNALFKKINLQDTGMKGLNLLEEHLRKSIVQFKNTIVDLTEISKLEQDEFIEEVELNKVLEEVKFSIAELISSSNTTIVSSYNCTVIRFSKSNLKSIFYNMISNAIKYKSPVREPLIHITSLVEDQFWVLQFQDNGLGIKSADQEKIFDMFKRVHNHVEGSGVGLYIVKRIIENSKGRITVQSEIDKGSLFTLYIPIDAGE